jgi:hypothetical protein
MSNEIIILQKEVENRIFVVRGVQIMIDRDLAELYQTETRTLKQAIKRNLERFPKDFMFELSENEIGYLVSQFVIPSKSHFGGAKPYAFTEQGVAMLSSVLKTPAAVSISLRIIRVFVEMRKIITHNAALFQRLDKVEFKQIEADQKFEKIFKALERKDLPEKGVFFDGQVYDAYIFVANLIRKAEKSLTLVDSYIDDTILTLFTKRAKNVTVIFYTKTISKQLQLDLAKHNAQYDPITVVELADAHDRFLIIDDKELYHIGASLKDLGKKWFAFSKMDAETVNLLNKLKKKT